MIEKLPLEVLEILYSFLDRNDLCECQCVNQSWYQRWIPLIYRKVHLYGEQQLIQFLNPAISWSLRGQQVRKLVIEKGHVQPDTLGQLPLMFPFVEVFMIDGVVLCEAARKKTLHHYQQRKQQEEILKIKGSFGNWAACLRQLVEFNGITVAHCILTENKCPNLTRLSLQFINTNDLTNAKLSLLAAFKNIPALEHLSLERIFLDVDELERIHQCCPRLESLRLKSAAFLPMAAVRETSIKPALGFLSFECVDSSFCEDVVHWLEYIAMKYCHAEIIEVGCCRFGNTGDTQSDGDILYQNSLLLLASTCRRLKKLKLSSLSLNTAFLNTLDRHGVCLKEITLGDGLSYLLDHEMKALVESRQKNTISRLVIHGWPTILVPGGMSRILLTLHNCPFLTHVVLNMGRHSLQLHQSPYQQSHQKITAISNEVTDLLSLYQVIQQCPHLTHLTITEAKLLTITGQVKEEECWDQFISKLHTLVIENCLFDHYLFSILSYTCPQLKDISISTSVFSPETHLTGHAEIHLPQHSLDRLVIDCIRVSRHCSVRLGTSCFFIRTRYDAVGYDLMEFEWRSCSLTSDGQYGEQLCAKKVKNVDLSNMDQKVHLSVLCKDIKSLYLSGLEVIRNGNFLFK